MDGNLVKYMIKTTSEKHADYVTEERKSKRNQWERSLRDFGAEYEFVDLIFEDEDRDSKFSTTTASDKEMKATVSFVAKMKRRGLDRTAESMEEVSTFELSPDGKQWLYLSAQIKNPFKNVRGDVVVPQRKAVTTDRKGVPKGN